MLSEEVVSKSDQLGFPFFDYEYSTLQTVTERKKKYNAHYES